MRAAKHRIVQKGDIPASLRIATAAAAVLVAGSSAHSAVFDWSSSAGSTSWDVGANWIGGAAPADNVTADSARFNQSSYTNQPSAGTVSVNGIQISDGTKTTAPLTISGTSLAIGSGGITMLANSGATVISSPTVLGISQIWANNSSSLLTVSGNIASGGNTLTIAGSGNTILTGIIGGGAGGVVKSGSGTLILSGLNTYTGLTAVNSGVLQIGNNDNVLSVGSGNYSVAAGAQLVFNRNATPNGLAFFNQSIGGAGDVIFKGQSTGYFTFRNNYVGALNYTGKTVVNYDPAVAGTTWFQRGFWLEKDDLLPHASVLDLQSGKVFLRSNAGAGETVAGLIGNAGTFVTTDQNEVQKVTMDVPSGQSYSFDGVIGIDASPLPIEGVNQGNISVTKAGAGTQILNGNNTYSGPTTVNNGTLVLTGSNTLFGATVVNGGTLLLDYTGQNSGKISDFVPLELGGGNISITPNASMDTVQSVLGTTLNAGGSTVTVNKNGGANNASLHLNEITRSAGATLNVVYGGTGSGSAAATTDTLNNSNGILDGWATFNGSTWAVNSTGGADGAIAPLNPASFTANTWSVNNHTDVTSNTAPSANATTATLRFHAASANTVTLSGDSAITSGGILVTPNVGSNASTITGGTLQASGELFVHQYNPASSLTITSTIVDGGVMPTTLVKAGPGTLIVSDANAYTGPTIISGGTLQAGKIGFSFEPSSLGSSFNGEENLILNGGKLQYTGATTETDRGFTLNGAGGTIDVSTGDVSLLFGGAISGAGGLTKSGPGKLVLGGTTLYEGRTEVSGGILQIGNNDSNTALNRGSFAVAAGAQLVFARNADTVAFTTQSISGAGDVVFTGQDFGYFTFRTNYTGTLSYTGKTIIDYNSEVGGTWFQRTLWLEKDDVLPHSTELEIRSGKIYLRSNVSNGTTVSGLTGGPDTLIATDQGATQKFTINVPSGKTFIFEGEIGMDPALATSTANIALTKTGPGTQVLSGANSFNGGLRINEGTIKIGVSSASATAVGSGPVTLGTSTTNATLDLNGQTEIVSSLMTGNGASPNGQLIGNSSTTGDATLMITGTSDFGGIIQDSLNGGTRKTSLSVTGGTVTLTNANTYTGNTNVTAGKLLLGAGGSLSNNNAISISNGAAFAATPGTATLNVGSISLESGSVFDMTDGANGVFDLTGSGTALTIGSAPGAGVRFNFDLNGGGTDRIVVSNAAAVTGLHTISITASGSSLIPSTYTLISAASGLGGTFQFPNGSQEMSVLVGTTTYRLLLANTGTAQTLSVLSGILGAWGGPGSTTNTPVWATASNWANGVVPGTVGTTNNFDTAVFNSNRANATPVVDAGRNVQSITFDTANVGALNLSGSALTLTSGGVIQTTASVTNNQTISAPLNLQGDYSVLSRAASSATLAVSGSISAAASANLTLGGSNAGANSISGLISNGAATLGITKGDSGTWALTNPGNSFTGNININGGRLNVASGALGSTGRIVFGGGALQYANGNTQDLSARIENSTGPIHIDTNGNNITYGNSISSTNTAGLTKSGPGTLILTGANAYTGPTTLLDGTLRVPSVGAALLPSPLGASSSAPENLVFDGGALQYTGASAATDRGFTVNAAGGVVDVATENAALTFLGQLRGPGGLTKTGPGTLILEGASSYAGLTTVGGGALQIGNNNADTALNPGDFSISSGAQLVFSRNNDNVAFLTQSISGAGDVVFTGQSRGYFTWRTDYTGTLSYTGKTIVNYDPDSGGTWFERGFWLEKDDLLPHSTILDLQSGKTFLRNNVGAGETISGLMGNAETFITTDQVPVQKLNINVPNGQSYTYAGTIGIDASFTPIEGINAGNIALTKSGPGTQILSGNNTYSGTTTVNGGTLLVSGSIAGSATVVNAGGTLASGVEGAIQTAFGGNLSVTNGGTLSPGGLGAVGTLTLDIGAGGKLNFSPGSTLEMDLGVLSDLISFFAVDDWLSGSGNLTLALNGSVDYGRSYTVFKNVTTPGFTLAGITGYDIANFNAVFAQTGSEYQLSFVAVPEPASAASLIAGIGCLLGLRRFRRPSRV